MRFAGLRSPVGGPRSAGPAKPGMLAKNDRTALCAARN